MADVTSYFLDTKTYKVYSYHSCKTIQIEINFQWHCFNADIKKVVLWVWQQIKLNRQDVVPLRDRTNTNPRDHLPSSSVPELKDDGRESSLTCAPLVWLSQWLDKSAVRASLKGDGPQFQLESQLVNSHSIMKESFHPLNQLCLNLQKGSPTKKVSPSKMSTTIESTGKRESLSCTSLLLLSSSFSYFRYFFAEYYLISSTFKSKIVSIKEIIISRKEIEQSELTSLVVRHRWIKGHAQFRLQPHKKLWSRNITCIADVHWFILDKNQK